jgi:hypothetical protein
MNPLQVAQDYANEEGFDFALNDDPVSVDIWHPNGAARVYEEGQVISLPNPRLKAVLEKKIAQARANEAQLIQDPSGPATIKFSAEYSKMPYPGFELPDRETRLLAVFRIKRSQLSAEFLEWDTAFRNTIGNFPLPSGQEFLVLMLLTEGRLWTTIRAAWPPEKEGYYRSHVGEPVNIQIQGGDKR